MWSNNDLMDKDWKPPKLNEFETAYNTWSNSLKNVPIPKHAAEWGYKFAYESLQKELSRLQGEIREAVDNYIFNPCEHCPGFDCSGCTREEKYNKWLERNK